MAAKEEAKRRSDAEVILKEKVAATVVEAVAPLVAQFEPHNSVRITITDQPDIVINAEGVTRREPIDDFFPF